MESYFFVPASNRKFVEKSQHLDCDYLVLDLEDSVLSTDLASAFENIKELPNKSHCFLRIPLSNDQPDETAEMIHKMRAVGYNQFILPKLLSIDKLRSIVRFVPDIFKHKQLLLIEHPRLLLDLKSILAEYNFFAIALGSHDYTNVMRMDHNDENLYWSRHYILNHAKAFGIRCLDIASMNIADEKGFSEECKKAYSLGFDGKLLIHPMQLAVINSSKFYSEEDISFALLVRKKIQEVGGLENFGIANIKGKIVEKPHLRKYLDILNKEGYDPI